MRGHDPVVFEQGDGGRCVRVQVIIWPTDCIQHTQLLHKQLLSPQPTASPFRAPPDLQPNSTRPSSTQFNRTGVSSLLQTACPHHVCIVIFSSDEHLHSNVFPDSLEPTVTPGLALLRLVPYGRKGIDAFGDAVERDITLWQSAIPQLDSRLRARWEAMRSDD